MKKLALIAGVLALGACQAEPAEEPVTEETEAPVADDLGLEVDGKPNVGTYEVTEADGTVGTYVAAPDGTYTYTQGETVTTGTWSSDSPGKWCDHEDGAAEPVCFTETIDENGVWTSVNDADPASVATIKRIE